MIGQNDKPIELNIADLVASTYALGPGLRSAIWVQGCPIGCKGCIAPDWIPFHSGLKMQPKDAAKFLLSNPKIEGITISGGEPTFQAIGLTRLLNLIRKERNDLHIICFSGYTYEYLLSQPPEKGISDFLSQIDLLIDGPYIQKLNTGNTFAGSQNQRMIRLSTREMPENGTFPIRQMEFHIRNGSILAVGVPPDGWDPNLLKRIGDQSNIRPELVNERA